MSGATAIALALAVPAGAAVLSPLLGRWPNLREAVTLVAGLVLLLLVVGMIGPVVAGAPPGLTVVEMFPGLALAFAVEPLGLLFALVASGLWIVTAGYSIGYMRGHHEKNQSRFYGCFALAIAAAIGIAFARNMLTLFVFYEALTLSTYPLVTHHQTDRARRAGRVYLGVLLTTSIGLLLLGMIWTWSIAGTLEFTPGGVLSGKADPRLLGVLLALYAFGTGKAALMPFHRWLPAAMVAPTPVSALLHAVAVVKAGVFTILKVTVYLFGIETLRLSGSSLWLTYVAGFTIVAASLVALTKDNLKARLAYSTISQLSYIVLGAALANTWSVVGGGMHIAMHAMGKITLFFCAGAIYVATDKTEVSQMRGIGRRMPITTFAFLLGSLSVIGLPPMGGSWSKWFLALGAAEAGQLALVALLMVSSLLNIAYLLPIPARGFFSSASDSTGDDSRFREAPIWCVVPLSLTALGCVALFFFADEIYRLLLPIVQP